jgi:NAD(P)H dehydrogenase (quinone)
MSPVNVLVIFYSRTGSTEALALAAAVGAVQARANIRLRRLPDPPEDHSSSGEALTRMRKEYVPPTQADTLWADAVIVGLNGKVAGTAGDTAAATALGRRIAMETRALKNA